MVELSVSSVDLLGHAVMQVREWLTNGPTAGPSVPFHDLRIQLEQRGLDVDIFVRACELHMTHADPWKRLAVLQLMEACPTPSGQGTVLHVLEHHLSLYKGVKEPAYPARDLLSGLIERLSAQIWSRADPAVLLVARRKIMEGGRWSGFLHGLVWSDPEWWTASRFAALVKAWPRARDAFLTVLEVETRLGPPRPQARAVLVRLLRECLKGLKSSKDRERVRILLEQWDTNAIPGREGEDALIFWEEPRTLERLADEVASSLLGAPDPGALLAGVRGLARRYDEVAPNGPLIARACALHLFDPSPLVRSGVLHFFRLTGAPDWGTLAEAHENHRDLFAGVEDPCSARKECLSDLLLDAMSVCIWNDPVLGWIARRESLRPEGAAYARMLIRRDPAWIQEHLEEVIRENPTVLGDLLAKLHREGPVPRTLIERASRVLDWRLVVEQIVAAIDDPDMKLSLGTLAARRKKTIGL